MRETKRLLLATLIVTLMVPLFSFFSLETSAISDSSPFTPHEVKVLVVSPANTYFKGGHYLIADLARYGFNVTQHTSDNATSTNYLTDPKTSNLGQYDVVILHGGYFGYPPTSVTIEEVNHFINYGGILIVIGNALFVNETSGTWWDNIFSSVPIQRVEQKLGVDFTEFLRDIGASEFHNNGAFTLAYDSIPGLPTSISYIRGAYPFSQFQMALSTSGANKIYDFTTQDGITTCGVTFFKNSTGAVGIYIQGSYIYATSPGTNQINYFGLTDVSNRPKLLGSLVAFALEKDIDTIIKAQPLANIRLDGVGQYYAQTQTYLNASLYNFNSAIDAYSITPTAGFIDFLDFKPDYWQTDAPKVLSQLKGKYSDWEYSTSLRYYTDPRPMTKAQIEALIDSIKDNYSMLGMDLFSTVIAPGGYWNQSTLGAMVSKNLYLIDILDTYYSDWWRLRVNSSVIVHSSAQMLPELVWPDLAENFTQPGLDEDSVHCKYFSQRDRFALAILNGFAGFVYYVPNFRWNEVGTFSLRTVDKNLTSEIPDVRFVPLIEAGLYFGNKWMQIENATRVGSTIEFDVDASAIPDVVNIGKGMLWLRINANESIQEVSIDDDPWFYFDDHSIRMPAPMNLSHVKVTLGESQSPRVAGSPYKVIEARYDGYLLVVSISSAADLNVSARLYLPPVGPFSGDQWISTCSEITWRRKFDDQSRILEFWTISDGFATFKTGVFWSVKHTNPWYDLSVKVTVNFRGVETDIREVLLSYSTGDEWTNVTMDYQNELYIAKIPAMPYGTVVRYNMFVSDESGKWLVTGIFSYDVVDETPPEIGVPQWDPFSPSAGKSVHVGISVTEPENASGVERAVLYYYLNRDYATRNSVNMTREDSFWSAVIPGQGAGKNVSFFVIAHDTAGNVNQTLSYSYTVGSMSLTLPFQVVLVGVGIAVVVVIILYFAKFRKTKHAN